MNRTTILLTLTILSLGGTAQADTRVDLTPSIAYVNPTKDVVDQDGVTAKFDGALAFGGRVSIWLNTRVALEFSGHYGRSSLDGEITGITTGSIDIGMFYGSAQVAVALDNEHRFLLHGGLGMQSISYDELIDGGSIATGVLGMSGVMPFSPSVALRSDLDVHIHTYYYEVGDVRTDELNQVDAVLTLGLQFTPGAKAE